MKGLRVTNHVKESKFETVWGKFESKKMFPETITYKKSETETSFHVKKRKTAKIQFLFFKSFLLVLTKLSFWQGDWGLGYHYVTFRKFPNIS